MTTQTKSIRYFQKGDYIVRTAPSKSYGDRSYIGEKLTFIGIANGNIYLEREEDNVMTKILGTKQIVLALDIWNEDWQYWENPEDLFAKEPILNEKYLQYLLDKAVLEENYEEAEKIKNQLKDLL